MIETSKEYHPIAAVFPEMPVEDFTVLVEDIRVNGLIDSIITLESKILDGRHRFKACLDAGVEPRFEEYEGDDPVGFVVSKNLHRRHLTPSQRGVISNELARLPHGGDRSKRSIDRLLSQAQAAELMQVSEATVRRIRRVEREAPELIEPVRKGEMTIHAATKQIKKKNSAASRPVRERHWTDGPDPKKAAARRKRDDYEDRQIKKLPLDKRPLFIKATMLFTMMDDEERVYFISWAKEKISAPLPIT